MALLPQFLVAFGTAVGAGAHHAVEASHHHSNGFILLSDLVPRGGRGRVGITSRR